MTEQELWIQNERGHAEMKKAIEGVGSQLALLEKSLEIIPLLIRWVCFPLILILGTVYGAATVITKIVVP